MKEKTSRKCLKRLARILMRAAIFTFSLSLSLSLSLSRYLWSKTTPSQSSWILRWKQINKKETKEKKRDRNKRERERESVYRLNFCIEVILSAFRLSFSPSYELCSISSVFSTLLFVRLSLLLSISGFTGSRADQAVKNVCPRKLLSLSCSSCDSMLHSLKLFFLKFSSFSTIS